MRGGLAALAVVSAGCYAPSLREDGESDAATDARVCADDFLVTDLGLTPCGTEDFVLDGAAISTDSETIDFALLPPRVASVVSQPSGPDIWVLHFRHLSVSGTNLVAGSRPLALVAYDLEIAAGAVVLPMTDAAACGATGGEDGGGGGGGGGGFAGGGGVGGRGLDGTAVQGGVPGGVYGNLELVPIVPGCSGGAGGNGTPATPGGGALILAAANELRVAGIVCASGRPGLAGDTAAGGAGGGSGGSLLLEAPTLLIADTGALLALGGGGGGAGMDAVPGVDTCDPVTPPWGGSGETDGGAGGDELTADGQPGQESASIPGSGGGGGVGRIRLNGTVTAIGAVRPAASRGPLP